MCCYIWLHVGWLVGNDIKRCCMGSSHDTRGYSSEGGLMTNCHIYDRNSSWTSASTVSET